VTRRSPWQRAVAHATALPGAWEDHPWGPEDTVVKVGRRIFLFCGAGDGPEATVTVRCRPDDVAAWRARYPEAIGPAPYLARKPWNRVRVADVPLDDLLSMVDDSHEVIVGLLPRRERPATP
jgi:predicted DNA-binding protein (MmcQ/YjbR family)